MEFIKYDNLIGLKVYIEDYDKRKYMYLFEKDCDAETLMGNGDKIVGSIIINKENKLIDFHVNDHFTCNPPVNYKNRGYGTKILWFIEKEIKPKFPSDYEYTIVGNHELYLNFKKHIDEKMCSSVLGANNLKN